jgi:hypothetical protein
VKYPKFPNVFTLAPPSLFKSGLAVIAPLCGRTVKSTVGESFSLHLVSELFSSCFSFHFPLPPQRPSDGESRWKMFRLDEVAEVGHGQLLIVLDGLGLDDLVVLAVLSPQWPSVRELR